MTEVEWLEFCEAEGGIEEGFSYGLSAQQLDPDVSSEFKSLVNAACHYWREAQPCIDALREYADNAGFEI